MESAVEQEFERLKSHVDKPIKLTVVTHKGTESYWALLKDVTPYSALDIRLGFFNDGNFSGQLGEDCPFIGSISGIALVVNNDGEILYQNDNLRFEKRFYNPFQNQEDNEFINSMRRQKFGPGHDYKMFDQSKSF